MKAFCLPFGSYILLATVLPGMTTTSSPGKEGAQGLRHGDHHSSHLLQRVERDSGNTILGKIIVVVRYFGRSEQTE